MSNKLLLPLATLSLLTYNNVALTFHNGGSEEASFLLEMISLLDSLISSHLPFPLCQLRINPKYNRSCTPKAFFNLKTNLLISKLTLLCLNIKMSLPTLHSLRTTHGLLETNTKEYPGIKSTLSPPVMDLPMTNTKHPSKVSSRFTNCPMPHTHRDGSDPENLQDAKVSLIPLSYPATITFLPTQAWAMRFPHQWPSSGSSMSFYTRSNPTKLATLSLFSFSNQAPDILQYMLAHTAPNN